MISPEAFYKRLADSGVSFAAGVPDSLLAEFCAYVDACLPADRHLITANEGAAVAVAAGVQLGAGEVPLVYLQNSGLGNAINPLMSLVDPEVYAIPLVLLIGWRGEPGVADEPQHVKQGRVSTAMLDAMEIPWRSLDGDPGEADEIAQWAVDKARRSGGPVAILARKGVFAAASGVRRDVAVSDERLSRERAIAILTEILPADATVVSTTGKISRELYETRMRSGQDRAGDFLTVGSMGHASSIALGLALTVEGPVVCLDGDGAMLMHMGGVATIGAVGPDRLVHVVLNNGVHDSVGGQPTVAEDVSLTGVATASGYPTVLGPVTSEDEIRASVTTALSADCPAFVEIRVQPGARGDLGRPRETPAENKALFVARLRGAR